MQSFIHTAETELILDSFYNWENQLKDLKESFENFNLLNYEFKKINGHNYNYFKFTHEICINCNYNQ